MRALLAIEENVLAELIAFRLELLSYTVEVCNTKFRMMQMLDSSKFDILLVDTALPDSNIKDSVSSVRQKLKKHALGVMVVSLDPSLELVEQTYRVGADDYLLAPFDLNTLQTKIENMVKALNFQPNHQKLEISSAR